MQSVLVGFEEHLRQDASYLDYPCDVETGVASCTPWYRGSQTLLQVLTGEQSGPLPVQQLGYAGTVVLGAMWELLA